MMTICHANGYTKGHINRHTEGHAKGTFSNRSNRLTKAPIYAKEVAINE
jgi:hypothetical protein